MKRYILWSLSVLLLAGCGASTNYYLLGDVTKSQKFSSRTLPVIGVEKILLPDYLQQNKVVIQLSPTQLKFSDDDQWAEDMENSLSKQLIVAIQKSFNHPDVYIYPWDLSKQAGMKIKVSVSKFIAYGDQVYLDANWEIVNLQTGQRSSRLFSTQVKTAADTASIVASMNSAFARLTTTITREIAQKF
jgi:cholesterol transport system auxiliary component